MNIDQMHIEITQGVQRLASHIDYDLQKEEIDLHLNHVIKNFVLSHFTFSENKGFEINHKSTQDIQTLIIETEVSPDELDFVSVSPFKYQKFSYPEGAENKYYLPISISCEITIGEGETAITSVIKCDREKQDNIYRLLDDQFNTKKERFLQSLLLCFLIGRNFRLR